MLNRTRFRFPHFSNSSLLQLRIALGMEDGCRCHPDVNPNCLVVSFCRCSTYGWLVVEPYPSEKQEEIVNWDDENSQLNGKIIQMFQSPPTRWNIYLHRNPTLMSQFCSSIFQHHGSHLGTALKDRLQSGRASEMVIVQIHVTQILPITWILVVLSLTRWSQCHAGHESGNETP